jgi:gliding-associated putative ABC transporter substrate-binding component GldG
MGIMNSRKVGDILKFLNLAVMLLLLNIMANRNFFRLDLTEEKRYSISTATKEILTSLDDNILVEVYLGGELPPAFERMQKSIREILEEFRIYSDYKVSFRFIDPEQAGNAQSRQNFFQSISEKGILPYDVFMNKDGNRIQKRILPGAVVSYGLAEKGVQLFKGNQSAAPEVRLNQSIEGIEYEIASTIKTITNDMVPAISFITGHGELDSINIISFRSTLSERYRVQSIDLPETIEIPNTDLIIIIKPVRAFSDQDKFKIDQYIMRGGRAMFLLDMLNVKMDSIQTGTFAFGYDLALQDLLFKYGVRLNQDLIQDVISGSQPIVIGSMGDQPQIQLMPWPFNPILNNFSAHLITRNLDAIYGRFVSSIDTVKATGVAKIPLLYTSAYTRRLSAPVRVSAEDLKIQLTPDQMNEKNIPVAYLLEGTFTSLYKNRFPPPGIDRDQEITGESGNTGIIVITDGDIARNEINSSTGRPMELGYDPYSRQMFGNMDFLLNAVDYLVDGKGLITARAKEVQIRPLDKVKIGEQKGFWQTLNLVTPLVLLFAYGIIRFYLRKRRYANFK